MSPEQFCFFLKGVFQQNPTWMGLDPAVMGLVKQKLDSVFTHVESRPPAVAPNRGTQRRFGTGDVQRIVSEINSAADLPPAGQCQRAGDCLGSVCDNPRCKPQLEAMC